MYEHVLVNELFKYYREKCEHVLKAMNQVKGSKRLRGILHVCLKGGNILNADSKQLGISQGFKLNSFSKITSTKGNQKGPKGRPEGAQGDAKRVKNRSCIWKAFLTRKWCHPPSLFDGVL